MKSQFLKIGGVKTEKEFYDKYPTEEEFFAKCGAKIKKAFPGMKIPKANNGMMQQMGQMGQGGAQGGGGAGVMSSIQSIGGTNPIGTVMDYVEGFKQQKERVNKANQNMQVMGFMEDAQESNQLYENQNLQDARQKSYVRPEDTNITGEELFPMYGVGTNVLAKNGRTFKNKPSYNLGGPVDPPGKKKKQVMDFTQAYTDLQNTMDQYPPADQINDMDSLQTGFRNSLWLARQSGNLSKEGLQGSSSVLTKNNYRTEQFADAIREKSKKGNLIRRKDGSYSQRGLWDNIRANKGSGKKPTKEMLKQEKKIKALSGVGISNAMSSANTQISVGAGSAGKMGMLKDMGMEGFNSFMPQLTQQLDIGGDMGSKLGGDIGGKIGAATGIPGMDMVGQLAGGALGDALDRSDTKIEGYNDKADRSMNNMIGMKVGRGMQSKFGSNMKNGGTIYGMDGNAQTYSKGGSVTPISDNPYGSTEMINGPSHKKGGVDMNIYNTPLEAEGGEPMVGVDEDGDNVEDSISIMGNLEVPSHLKKSAEAFTGEKIKGKKFKNVTKNIGEIEKKQTDAIEKNIEQADDYTPIRALDRISLSTLNLNIEQADKKLQKLQVAKEGLATAQDFINQQEQEQAKYGKKVKAQYGYLGAGPAPLDSYLAGAPEFNPVDEQFAGTDVDTTTRQTTESPESTNTDDTTGDTMGSAKSYKKVPKKGNNLYGNVTENKVNDFKKRSSWWFDFDDFNVSNKEDVKELQKAYNKKTQGKKVKVDGKFGPQTLSMALSPTPESKGIEMNNEITGPNMPEYASVDGLSEIENKESFEGFDLGGLGQLFRDTDAQEFDNSQLLPEAWAMANNKLEPVQAQKYNPRLRTPYDISMQDQLNQNTAKARMAERMAQQAGVNGRLNPGALAALKAQEYMADQNVLGQQFRANQQFKDQVYNQNINTLNDAALKNLAIADTQYTRQEQARSNTRATDFEAIKSMTDKRLKQNLENQTLRVFENMYDYRFGPGGRAQYMGEGFNPEDMWGNSPGGTGPQAPEGYEISSYDKHGRPRFVPISKSGKTPGFNPNAKNGTIVKNYKKFK